MTDCRMTGNRVWTSFKPTTPGEYWFRNIYVEEVEMTVRRVQGLLKVSGGQLEDQDLRHMVGEWSEK